MTLFSSNYPTLADWSANEAIPFALDSATAFQNAVDKMVTALGDSVELLGLGEAVHGSEEILILRNRLFQHLVAAHGYSAIAIESSFPRAYLVNEYLAGRGPALYEAVQESGFSHNAGRLEANRELVEWMRDYNANPAHSVKLQFYGFDSPTEMYGTDSPRQVLQFVLDYAISVGMDNASIYRQRIEDLLGTDAAWENPAALMEPAQSIGLSPNASALRLEVEELIADLTRACPELVAKSDKQRYLEALHYAEVARQLLTYHAGLARPASNRVPRLLGLRDAAMADNLSWLVERERGRGKVLVFAHNSHLQRGQAQWQPGPEVWTWWTAGAHLHEMLGSGYAVIGSAIGESVANGIAKPEAGTLESYLTAALGPLRFLPTHRGRGLPTAEIETMPLRSGSVKNPTYFPLTSKSLVNFDWLVALDSTTYNRGGPSLERTAPANSQ